MQGKRSLGLPLENPLHHIPKRTRRSISNLPGVEDLEELFDSLSLEESSSRTRSSNTISGEEVEQENHTMAGD